MSGLAGYGPGSAWILSAVFGPVSAAKSKWSSGRFTTARQIMDKKAKKRIEVLRQKLTKLQQQLSGAKQQPDDPQDIVRLQQEIAAVEAELTRLRDA